MTGSTVAARNGAGTPGSIIAAGEALVDLAPDPDGRLRPLPGGSPYNVAVGLGRLGADACYLGPLSTDGFGDLLRMRLADAGVALALPDPVAAPTTLAVVHLDAARRASYGFYLEATSAAALVDQQLPSLPDGAMLHVSFGAIGVTQPTTGAALCRLVEREAGHRLVTLDPNLRPDAVGDDADAYLQRLDTLAGHCDLVKVSDEDLAALGSTADEGAQRWLEAGAGAVVVTLGPDGAEATTATDHVTVGAPEVAVVDTVGAGDAFTAGLLDVIRRTGVRDRAGLEALGRDGWIGALERAITVAAVTCTRAGADPPTADDLAAWST